MPSSRRTTPRPGADRARAEAAAAAVWRLYPHTFGEHVSGGAFRAFAYQRWIGRKIAEAVARGGGRIIINIPSRHGKSELCSRWVPTWLLDNCPHKRVIVACYGSALADEWGRKVRNEFATNPRLITRLRDDSKAANRWHTPEGGGMLTVGVGGPVVGFGGDLIVVDDPHKDWFEAKSPVFRKRVVEWFGSTLYSRREPGATIVVLMQRMDPEDLAGFLIRDHPDPWQVFRLPALAVAGDPMGRRPGQALCPERYDELALAQTRAGMTADGWAAMFQQDPGEGAAGRAYRAYDPAAHDDKTLSLRPDLPLQLGWDFNVNPGIHCELAQYDRRADRFAFAHEIHGPRMKTPAAMEAFEALLKRLHPDGRYPWPEVHVYGDRSGTTENTTTDVTDYRIIEAKLAAMRLPFKRKVPAANPPVKRRMAAFNDALRDAAGAVHLALNPLACPRLKADLERVKEDADGLVDKSDEALTHPSDAAGYLINYQRPVLGAPRQGEGRAGGA